MLTFFGFMHGEAVGFAVTPMVALAYGIVAGFLFACARSTGGDGGEGRVFNVDVSAQPAE